MKVAVIGATGLVGQTMINLLEARDFPLDTLLPAASRKSKGKTVTFRGKAIPVMEIEEALASKPDIALFSAGSEVSLAWAERFADVGCYVIDNSSAWRMDPDKRLIVPEVNGARLSRQDRVIANPNCSTIQMVMVLKPLQDAFGLKRVVVSTYQSVTGSGQKGIDQLTAERAGGEVGSVYPHPIDRNVLPHIDVFQDNGNTKEEMKMIRETQKILDQSTLAVSATTVRVPVLGGHSESVNIEMNNEFDLETVRELLRQFPGVEVEDDPAQAKYPTPLTAVGKDAVFVGRIRRDHSQPNTLNCWIVADNLRKGAATNAVQIAEWICKEGWVQAAVGAERHH